MGASRCGAGGVNGGGCGVPRAVDGVADLLVGERSFVVGHLHAAGQQVDGDVGHAVELADGLLDVRLARRAGHSAHVESLLSHMQLPSYHLNGLVYPTPLGCLVGE